MEWSNIFGSKSSQRRDRHRAYAIALFLIGALLIVACSKNTNTGITSDSGSISNIRRATNSSNTASTGGMSREEMKSMADKQGQATVPDKGNFKVVYSTTQNEKYAQMNESLKQSGLLEELADQLNATVALPADVNITVKECGKVTAQWNPQDRAVAICFEMMEDMESRLKPYAKISELPGAVRDSLMFALIHELGHALNDLLKLPQMGKSEDAMEQVVTFVLLDSASDKGEQMALSGAMWWERLYQEMARKGDDSGELDQAWAREHSFNAQRFYNIVCWIYGHNPSKYQSIVNNPLPEARANLCPDEYGRVANTWTTPLKPYLKDAGTNAQAPAQASRQATGGG